MRNRKSFFLLFNILLFLSISVFAEEGNLINTFRNFHWEENPQTTTLDSNELKQSYVVLKDDLGKEYFYDNNGEVVMYNFKHKIVHLNDNAAINQFNKVYVYLGDSKNTVVLRARSIQPDGTIINVPDSSIKDVENYHNRGHFKIFAIDGLVKGSEVEYYYIIKRSPYFYSRINFQTDNFIKEQSFTLLSPANLIFTAKGYNGLGQTNDSIYAGIFHLSLKKTNIPAYKEEPYSSEAPNLMYLDYRFVKNTNGPNPLSFNYTWREIGVRFFNNVYLTNKKAIRRTTKMLRKAGIAKIKDKKSQLVTLENYIKDHFEIQEEKSDKNDLIPSILKKKKASNLGIIRLYAAAFSVLGINNELVLCTNRKEGTIDPEFPNWSLLKDYLFYFPSFDSYLQPTDNNRRHGSINPYYRAGYGLFIRPDVLKKVMNKQATISSGISIDSIPQSDYRNNDNKSNLNIHINNDFSKIHYDCAIRYYGYEASFIKPMYDKLSSENQGKIIDLIIKNIVPDADIISKKVLNHNIDSSSIEYPFTIKSQFTSDKFISYANNDRIFNIGMVIGKQMEMYNEEDRKHPIMMDHTHEYHRTITFNIPEGYKVKGLDKLNIDLTENMNKKTGPDIGFVSNYTINKDSTITIKIHEYYSQVYYKVKDYQKYRKIINAAANFNKISLLFIKK